MIRRFIDVKKLRFGLKTFNMEQIMDINTIPPDSTPMDIQLKYEFKVIRRDSSPLTKHSSILSYKTSLDPSTIKELIAERNKSRLRDSINISETAKIVTDAFDFLYAKYDKKRYTENDFIEVNDDTLALKNGCLTMFRLKLQDSPKKSIRSLEPKIKFLPLAIMGEYISANYPELAKKSIKLTNLIEVTSNETGLKTVNSIEFTNKKYSFVSKFISKNNFDTVKRITNSKNTNITDYEFTDKKLSENQENVIISQESNHFHLDQKHEDNPLDIEIYRHLKKVERESKFIINLPEVFQRLEHAASVVVSDKKKISAVPIGSFSLGLMTINSDIDVSVVYDSYLDSKHPLEKKSFIQNYLSSIRNSSTANIIQENQPYRKDNRLSLYNPDELFCGVNNEEFLIPSRVLVRKIRDLISDNQHIDTLKYTDDFTTGPLNSAEAAKLKKKAHVCKCENCGKSIDVKDKYQRDWYFYHTENYIKSENTESISELIIGFFKYYGYEHDYVSDVVSVRLGSAKIKRNIFPKLDRATVGNYLREVKKWKHILRLLAIEDPMDRETNLGRNINPWSVDGIRAEMRRAYYILSNGHGIQKVVAKYNSKELNNLDYWKSQYEFSMNTVNKSNSSDNEIAEAE
ncbi:Poly(A) RNA polymerase cid11 [Smittium mucronatum]|uniref:Poly(A) RNA polymerase cid11 n=1 Tax=Smittium mucronatum TaxID=133383 RepID=A0A1R0H8R2_9FUNG|nr:Poly(A) RNA polymerase cid11 [Smittium mucronatum]